VSRLLVVSLLAVAAPALAEERIRVLVRAEPEAIEELSLEEYVAGVVSAEMPGAFPPEALKAQAVAARSYALTRKIDAQAANRRWDIRAGVLAQAFRRGSPKPEARAAVDATAGEVLVLGVEPVEAYFHAVCGGTTEAGGPALGRDLPYLAPAACGGCASAPGARWTARVDARALGDAAGLGHAATAARVAARTATGRADALEVQSGARRVTVRAADLRRALGYAKLPSLLFDVQADVGSFVFEGRGQGHGAGMCQWGAAALARDGRTYREILARYYPGTDVVRMY
jgi:stage II sporulation protein D (peptidoglycan lytic transglycosylase)